MKKIIYSILMLLALSCSPLIKQDKPKEVHKEVKKEPIKHSNPEDDPVFWSDYIQIIGILSAKYGLSTLVTKTIILEFLKTQHGIDYQLLTGDTSVKYEVWPKIHSDSTINLICDKLFIDKKVIGMILFDFELWYHAKEKGTT